jgi:hypothetical protein
MTKKLAVVEAALEDVDTLIEDAADLTPKELEQERKAKIEEIKKSSWLADSAHQLAARIPVSIFAAGDLASAT